MNIKQFRVLSAANESPNLIKFNWKRFKYITRSISENKKVEFLEDIQWTIFNFNKMWFVKNVCRKIPNYIHFFLTLNGNVKWYC